MIIDITKSGYQKGYLPKVGVGVFHPFFATANAAFRREALQKTGGFDLKCATGEDIDLSIRVAAKGYELWFEPTALVTHYHRHSLRGLLRQWYQYGYGHAYLYRKHCQGRRLQVYRYRSKNDDRSPLGIAKVVDIPFPVYGMICLSGFHLIHLGLLAGLIFSLVGMHKTALIFWAIGAAAAIYYVAVRFETRRPVKSLIFCAIKYIADWAYVGGGLLGGIREGVIYLEATKSRRRLQGPGFYMTTIYFNFYGYRIAVTSTDDGVVDGVRRDFAYFHVEQPNSTNDLTIDLRLEEPKYQGLPCVPASVITPRNICFQHNSDTYLDYFGRASGVFNRHKNTLVASGQDSDLMREIAYLFILSMVGQHLDRQKLHRLHALAASYAGKSILLLLPSGGGKSTMALRLVREPGFSLLSEDTPLIDHAGRAHAFPLCAGVKIGKNVNIPPEFVRTVRRMEFDPKMLVDIAYFADRIAKVADPGVVLVGQRNLGNASEIVPLGRINAGMALVKNMVVGLGVYQGLEFLLERGVGELIGQTGTAMSRFIASMKLLSRAPAYRFVLGRDIDKNYQTLLSFIRSRWGAAADEKQ